MAIQDIPERSVVGFHPGGNVCLPAATYMNVSSTSVWTANDARGVRMIAHKSGTVQSVGFYVGVSSGNVDMGIYNTAATTRARLWSSGSTACGTVNTWQLINVTGTGSPIVVTEGDHFDVALAVDNGTISVGRLAAPTNAGVQQLTAPMLTSPATGAGGNKLSWSIGTQFPLPATLTESALVTTSAIQAHLVCVIT